MIAIEKLGELFENVQLQKVFEDGKTFVDCLPKHSLDEITKKYEEEKNSSAFSLKKFVEENFDIPEIKAANFQSNTNEPIEKHIEKLWNVLTHLTKRSAAEESSLINLPFPYVVPGGRFSEIYYWDSYFTMLGLQVSERIDLIQNMVDNFAFLIDRFGYVPNGNRSYFLGRSQPPFFSLMIKLLSEEKGKDVLIKYQTQLLKEYDFWMKGKDELNESNKTLQHVVLVKDGEILNRYFDQQNIPRAESYKEDVELAAKNPSAKNLFQNIRAACESGWDFSCRWFKDINDFASIDTINIIPVDLNCLMFHLEETIAESFSLKKNSKQENYFHSLSSKRKEAIQKYLWNENLHFYFDYNFEEQTQKSIYSMAAAFPLFFNLASKEEAEKVADVLKEKLLKPGGFVTTTENTHQQWDSPNGWAPLQWIAIKGLINYNLTDLAINAAKKWIDLNIKVFKRTGKLMEKYNVVDENLEAGGGEYPAQDGFGWTNGVLLKLMKEFNG